MRIGAVRLRRVVLLLVLLAIGLGLVALAGGRPWLVAFTGRLEGAVRGAGPWGAAAFVVLALLSSLLSPFSVVPIVPVAVLAWGENRTFVLLLGGWLLGGVAAYAIGRLAGRPLARSFASIDALERRLADLPRRRGLVFAVVARLLLPSEIGYAYGILRFRFWPYLLLTLVAELPSAIVSVYASGVLVQGRVRLFALVLLAAAVLALVVWLLRERFLRHDEGPPGTIRRSPA